jgi:ribosomal protein S18 acetylase RimI-like enzyme
MEDLKIRKADIEDAEAIAAVHVETWQNAYLGLIPDSYLQSLSIDQRAITWRENLQNQHSTSHILVAELADQIVGFIGVGANRDEDAAANIAEVFSIYVDPESQGFGIGSSLLNQALDFLKLNGFIGVVLWVLAENVSSRFWYESRVAT